MQNALLSNVLRSSTALACALALFSCGGGGGGSSSQAPGSGAPGSTLDGIDLTGAPEGIVDLPASVDARIRAVFSRYAAITAPSGQRIHILARPGVEDALIFRTRGVLLQHLGDVPGATLGSNKDAVADAMAARDATLAIAASSNDFDENDPDVQAVVAMFGDAIEAVYTENMVQEGSPAYVLPSPAPDATLGATATFVLRQGIRTVQLGIQPNLDAATAAALSNGWLTLPPGVDPADADEVYFAVAIDAYYGVWGHDPLGNGRAGRAGEYEFNSRSAMAAGDPAMVAVLQSFFSSFCSYPAFLDDGFTQTFEMTFTPTIAYTHRSRYLQRVGLRENGMAAGVNGNAFDNVFIGNEGDDRFAGGGGNDIADMQGGDDTLVLTGTMAQYTVTETSPGVFRIEDSVQNRDGIDDVRGAEHLQFSDGIVDL